MVEFGEWLCEEVLKAVPHRHFVFSIPKILRRYFLYDRRLLSGLSRCGWESLKLFFQEAVPGGDAVPGAVVAIQTFGDFPSGFHPHLHILVSDGSFHENGMFSVSPTVKTKTLEQIFRHKVFPAMRGTPFQRKDHGRPGGYAHELASFGFQRLLRVQNSAK